MRAAGPERQGERAILRGKRNGAAMDADEVLRQRRWSQEALRAAGFRFWLPRKRLVMARRLEAAMTVMSPVGPLQALAGDMLCYRPDGQARAQIREYEHWPVRQALFERDYRPWDEALPRLAGLEALQRAGCAPWYKYRGVWAQRLGAARRVQSLEGARPQVVAAGQWLLIGLSGEPWHMDEGHFRSRYHRPRAAPGPA